MHNLALLLVDSIADLDVAVTPCPWYQGSRRENCCKPWCKKIKPEVGKVAVYLGSVIASIETLRPRQQQTDEDSLEN